MTPGKRKVIIQASVAVALAIYMIVALLWIGGNRSTVPFGGFVVEIADSTNTNFVTREAIMAELGPLVADAQGRPMSSVNTDSIERILSRVDKIEEANAVYRPDGKVHIYVTPLRPVLRVFDHDGSSYYVNKDGKRMKASLRYQSDVPVVVNEGSADFNPVSLLPLLERLRGDSLYNHLVTAVNITRSGDIVLIPSIRGLVINLGDTSSVDDKLSRLSAMYQKVLPVKGWTYYDTLSVKWDRQVVASKRFRKIADTTIPDADLTDEEGDDIGTVMADSTAVKHTSKNHSTQ